MVLEVQGLDMKNNYKNIINKVELYASWCLFITIAGFSFASVMAMIHSFLDLTVLMFIGQLLMFITITSGLSTITLVVILFLFWVYEGLFSDDDF